MVTLGNIGKINIPAKNKPTAPFSQAAASAIQQLMGGGGGNAPVPLPPVNTQPPTYSGDQTPTGADNSDQLAQLASLLSGGGGGGGFRGAKGNSQAQTNLSIMQGLDLLGAQEATAKTQLGLVSQSLQGKKDYLNQNYQNTLTSLQQQYGSSLFNLNTQAAASGAYGSTGANYNRALLSQQLGQGQTQAQQGLTYNLSNIDIAARKAYANALLQNVGFGQQQAQLDLQRQEAGI